MLFASLTVVSGSQGDMVGRILINPTCRTYGLVMLNTNSESRPGDIIIII